MGLEININDESARRVDKFLVTNKYKELAENAMSFNRKLNEERKMRIPYVDGQTGVAQRHYDMMRKCRERMPGRREGQILSYPQRKWVKKRYQYLQHFLLPKHLRYIAESAPSLGETPVIGEAPVFVPEEMSHPMMSKDSWEYYDDEAYAMQEPIGSEPESDSDFEYESGRGKKGKGKKGSMGKSKMGMSKSNKKRSFDEERTPTQDRSSRSARRSVGGPPPQPPHPSAHHPPPPPPPQHHPLNQQQTPPQQQNSADSSVYCDFCLGDTVMNKKTGGPEELIACSICGRAGHPSCLQFTKNMMVSVRKYPWQCIECKSCTLCGTSENDDKLLFCDDCDRGYHMYCLVPPMKDAPEGSWSCSICIETFHKK